MTRCFFPVAVTALLLATGVAFAADGARGAVECGDLKWSAEVLAANPDIALACRGVYEKDGVLYARATIEVTRVQGSTVSFRTLRVDGTRGVERRVNPGDAWRFEVAGRTYRARDLVPGQQLNIYLPEDRFALATPGGDPASAADIETVAE